MSMTWQVSRRRRLVRAALRRVFRGAFRTLARVQITGLENVPLGEPYIVAINHVSLFDPPFALAFWPEMLEVLGAVEVWQRPGQGLLARWYGGIPVHRGEYDRRVLESALAVLQSGYSLLIAPEGGRSHQPGMRSARPGVGYLVEKSGVAVVPAAIVGTTEDFLTRALRGERPALEMHVGAALRFPPADVRGAARRRRRQQIADEIMASLARLLPSSYRGVYEFE